MHITLLIISIISIVLCYDISKENNCNSTLWTILSVFFGLFSLIVLLIVIVIKKKGMKKRKEITVLVILITIIISGFMYSKPIYMQKAYYGNMLDKGKIINKNVPITIHSNIYNDATDHKQIDYILTVEQVKSNRDTACNNIFRNNIHETAFLCGLGAGVFVKRWNSNRMDTQEDLYHIWDSIFFHMIENNYKRVTISQLIELKQSYFKDSEYWVNAAYPRVPEESYYLKN
ncbi:hypothetical protein OW763_13825 [Clostridium aestuarii]|uniref:DUF4760 domain-containing protein n=1 Tax=Clostridium aestuarii TaxID=338193 RepID=A0ABT4D5D8_9CLOT|nr:hypothetical protein [Clostridium aestuarii]MCY6485410.1 hypothetical protein [Clostridium aestuarii]